MSAYNTVVTPSPSAAVDPRSLALYNSAAPIFDAMNPDIRSFALAGGELIMWRGCGAPDSASVSISSLH